MQNLSTSISNLSFTSTKGSEVLCRLRNYISKELQNQSMKANQAHATYVLKGETATITLKIVRSSTAEGTSFATSKVILSAARPSMDMSMKIRGFGFFLSLGMVSPLSVRLKVRANHENIVSKTHPRV
jgi:hypothetical protein